MEVLEDREENEDVGNLSLGHSPGFCLGGSRDKEQEQ